MAFLETVPTAKGLENHAFRMPVQWVNRPHLDFRGFSGTVAAGMIEVGEDIRILPSGSIAKVQDIILFDQHLPKAHAGQAVTITLDKEVDASRGDMLVAAQAPCERTDHQHQTHYKCEHLRT